MSPSNDPLDSKTIFVHVIAILVAPLTALNTYTLTTSQNTAITAGILTYVVFVFGTKSYYALLQRTGKQLALNN